MATIYSNNFNSDGTVGPGEGALTEELGLATTQPTMFVTQGRGRLRSSTGTVTCGTIAGIGDEIRMLSLPSHTVLKALYVSSDGGSTAGDADLGIYLAGTDHDGALPSTNSVDCFSTTAVDTDTVHDRVNHFASGDFAGGVGKQLWELVNISDAATYTADPQVIYDIVFTVTVAFTVAVTRLSVEAVYIDS